MSLLTPAATKSQPFFEGATGLRQHDNASDNLVAGTYAHNPLEASATEADEWTSILLYLFQVAKAGGGAIAVRNTTGGVLNAGPVKILTPGFDATNSAFLIGAADAAGNNSANALLLASLPNNTNGVAYLGGSFVGAIDTSASTVGNPVYLAVGGGMTLSAPSGADQVQQVVGRVQVLANPGTVSGLVLAPTKIGTSFHQALSVTNALIANTTIDLTAKVTGQLPVPNGGTGAASLGTSKQPVLENGTGALTTMAAPTTADANADAIAGTSAAAKKALVLQASASQSANVFEIQNSSGIAQFAISLGSATASGPNNTNLGSNAGASLTSGGNNTNVGASAGSVLANGSYNTNIGALAGFNLSSGASNTLLGKNAAPTLTTGSSDVVIGADSDVAAAGTSNAIVIGGAANVKGASTSITISTQAVNTGVTNDLLIESGDVGLRRVAAKVLKPTDGAGNSGWLQNPAGCVRATGDTSFTSTTTLAALNGLSFSLQAGRTYTFLIKLSCSYATAGGFQVGLAGTGGLTATSIRANYLEYSNSAALLFQTATALPTSQSSSGTGTQGFIEINGTITVANAGTLIVQGAQAASNGTPTVFQQFGCYGWLQDTP